MANKDSVVAACDAHPEAGQAVQRLQKAGFDMRKLSIIGKSRDEDKQITGTYCIGERVRYWGKAGAFWSGLWGMPGGSGAFSVPGMGSILVAGPLVASIVGALEQTMAIGGLNALGVAFYNLGIPQNSITAHEASLKEGKLLVIAHGSSEEVARAREILGAASFL